LAIQTDRREFIRAMLAGGLAAGLYQPLARAMSLPANRRTGTVMDVEHVVILTQENRAFDHYFGAMNGVQGFADRFPIPAPGRRPRRSVFVQPAESRDASTVNNALIAPYHLDTKADFRLIRPPGTPHGFPDGQSAWDNGRMGEWPLHKHNHSMAYFTRDDIPFQYALAEAFTLCDAYHCALHLSTNPNRLFIWTGTHDPLGHGHGPAMSNAYDTFADPHGHGGYTWTTYPERLQEAGISFQVYQDMADNFSDNPLLGFRRYRDARTATSGAMADLARRTITTRDLDLLKADVLADRLPQVSWIVAQEALSEHPSVSTPLQGAEYTARLLDALTANPEVWAKTVLFINFDENDGLFDHVAPPAPPSRDPSDPARFLGSSTVPADDEYHQKSETAEDAPYLGRPYGLGPRVPMYVISPWSQGGYVASEVFDHTSVIRFLETRFGVHEPNISAWRRAVCGDLTSCFDFSRADDRAFVSALPPTAELSKRAAALTATEPDLPGVLEAPVQEGGVRRRRPTPYLLDCALEAEGGQMALRLSNNGEKQAAVFHIYAPDAQDEPPERHTVGAGLSVLAPLRRAADGAYDAYVVAPGSFHRRLVGRDLRFAAILSVTGAMTELRVQNLTSAPLRLAMTDMSYGRQPQTVDCAASGSAQVMLDLGASHGWYDLLVEADGERQRLAGHLENGKESLSDPAAFGPARLDIGDI
jgi:phospholipase C